MTASIYLTSAEGRTGKSAVALGVLDALLADAPRVGVFRPLIRSRVERDRVLELLLSRTLTSVNAISIASTMTRTVSASGMDWGVLAAAGVLTIIPGALVIYFVRNYIAKGFALGRV